MRIAVRPPEYLPRLSYIALMRHVDLFVVADTFQYSRQSFQNRSRIRTPDGWSWISVPLVGRQHGTPIDQTKIDYKRAWRSKHKRAFQYNYASTPYFAFFENSLETLFATPWETLAELTCATITLFHDLFQLKTELISASTLPGAPESVPAILASVQPGTLISPAPAFQKDQHVVKQIECFTYEEPHYRQHFEGFEPDITAFDLLCNYGPESASVFNTAG